MSFKTANFAKIQNLSTVWPEISMLGSKNLRRVIGYDFCEIRAQFNASEMWGRIYWLESSRKMSTGLCPREQGDELLSRTVWEECCSHAFQ